MIKIRQILNLATKSFAILYKVSALRLCLIMILTIAMGILPSLSLFVSRIIINFTQQQMELRLILQWLFIYIGLDFLILLLNKVYAYIIFCHNALTSQYITELIMEKTKDLELRDYEDPQVYNLIKRARDNGAPVIFNFALSFTTLIQAVITVGANVIIISQRNMGFNWIILCIILASIMRSIISIQLGKKQYDILRKRTNLDRQKAYYTQLLISDTAFKEIRLFDLTDYFKSKYTDLFHITFRQDRSLNIERSLKELVLSLVETGVMAYAFFRALMLAWYRYILIGDVTTFISALNNIKSSTTTLCNQISSIYTNSHYVNDLFEMFEYNTERPAGQPEELRSIDSIRTIEFKDVSFAYEANTIYALHNVNFKLENNKIYTLIGANASGKSTIIKLILGFYHNYTGTILVNDIDLRTIDMVSYRKLITSEFQDHVKYQLSLRENVALSNLDNLRDDITISKLLSQFGLINDNYKNLDSQLGFWFDGGTQLSGGEWLRIAISRTFFRNQADVVILDEPNAALDGLFSEKFFKDITQLTQDKITLLALNHLPNDMSFIDKILFIDEGSVYFAEHSELLNKCSAYKNIFER